MLTAETCCRPSAPTHNHTLCTASFHFSSGRLCTLSRAPWSTVKLDTTWHGLRRPCSYFSHDINADPCLEDLPVQSSLVSMNSEGSFQTSAADHPPACSWPPESMPFSEDAYCSLILFAERNHVKWHRQRLHINTPSAGTSPSIFGDLAIELFVQPMVAVFSLGPSRMLVYFTQNILCVVHCQRGDLHTFSL